MLAAHGRRTLGAADLRWTVVFGYRAWFKIVECEGLALDTRCIPGAPGPPKPNACLLIVLRERFQAHDGSAPASAPVAIPLSLAQLEGADGKRPFTFRLSPNATVIELHIGGEHAVGWPRPGSVDLDEAASAAGWRAVRSSAAGDDAGVVEALRDLLGVLERSSLLTPGSARSIGSSPPPAVVRFWGAIKPVVERFALSSTIESLGALAALTSHQVDRALQHVFSTFGIVGGNVRSLALHVRLKTAVLFLSSPDAKVGDVATLAGYGSVDAMGRAFRSAGLPAPRDVQKRLQDLAE
jgi:hypothetical protein